MSSISTRLWSAQGLSHYLEHMLFMGSKKYPDENEYDSYLTKHGGASNAFTELVGRLILRFASHLGLLVYEGMQLSCTYSYADSMLEHASMQA